MKKYLNIDGTEKILELYKCWPSDHDAEIISIFLSREKSKGKYGPTLEIKVHCFNITNELNDIGHYKTINHAQITIEFCDVVEFSLAHSFGTQNPLSSMSIDDIRSHQLENINYKVEFCAHLTSDVDFKCSSINILSLEEGIPIGSIYA